MSTVPLQDWENDQELADTVPTVPDDPFADDSFLSEFPDYPYEPLDEPFVPSSPVQTDVSVNIAPGDVQPIDGAWSWHDAALIGVERVNEAGATSYEVGCVDLYANPQTGDLGGNYLKLDSFDDVDGAAALYHELQGEIHNKILPPFYVAEFAARKAAERTAERGVDAPAWTACSPAEYAAYEEIRSLNVDNRDLPPTPALQHLLSQVTDLSGITSRTDQGRTVDEHNSTFQALHAIGIQTEGFDPDKDPPPFFDEQTNTAYWIGVFQPDRADSSNCVASILSLTRNVQSGDVEAQLAPCVPGDWDKAYRACERLLDAVEKGGIDRCFDTAESMALAADQRALWEKQRGMELRPDAAQELAGYSRSAWDIDL